MKNSIINRILIPVDLNNSSQEIIHLVIAISLRHNAEIRLLYVIDPSQYTFVSVDSLAVSIPHDEVIERETIRLQQWADTVMTDRSVSYTVECRTGSVAGRVVEAATDFKADLIVMDRPGTTGLLQYVIGSEAYYVIKHAPCPVLTVPEYANVRDFKQILFPLRPVPGTETKYELTRAIAEKNNAHLTVLGLVDQQESEQGKALNVNLAMLNKQLLTDSLDANLLLSETDSAVTTVLQQAEEQKADLIIITADRAANVRHLFIGPFYKQIISQAKIPVLTVKAATSIEEHKQPAKRTIIPLFPMLHQHTFPA